MNVEFMDKIQFFYRVSWTTNGNGSPTNHTTPSTTISNHLPISKVWFFQIFISVSFISYPPKCNILKPCTF